MTALITPVILTYNEAPNLGRVLERLRWAEEVVVVDSGSTDETCAIAAAEANVRVVVHPFEAPAAQWEFAVRETGIRTPWVLALDSDHVPDERLTRALVDFEPQAGVAAYRAGFTWCVHGRPLRGTLYPPREVLFRPEHARFEQVGHTQVLRVRGVTGELPGRLLHDDRKSMSRWLSSQWRYAGQEAALIASTPMAGLGMSGRVRKLLVVAPAAAFLMAYLWRGGILDGRAGLHYALERAVAECLIALALLRRGLGLDDS